MKIIAKFGSPAFYGWKELYVNAAAERKRAARLQDLATAHARKRGLATYGRVRFGEWREKAWWQRHIRIAEDHLCKLDKE